MIESKVIATITVPEQEDGDEAAVIVRIARNTVVLTISLRRNGDLAVCLPLKDTAAVAAALQRAAVEINADPT
jgi:hypothetical protein